LLQHAVSRTEALLAVGDQVSAGPPFSCLTFADVNLCEAERSGFAFPLIAGALDAFAIVDILAVPRLEEGDGNQQLGSLDASVFALEDWFFFRHNRSHVARNTVVARLSLFYRLVVRVVLRPRDTLLYR
jgi:hypothetical protein